ISLTFEGVEEDRLRAVDLCASLVGNHYGPQETVIAAMKEIGLHLAHQGQALFELLRNGEGSVVGLWSFPPHGVYRFGGVYVQFLPRWGWHQLGRKYVVLKRDNVWRIGMPPELGGQRGYIKMLKSLSAWPSIGPNFYTEDLQRQELPRYFSFAAYRRAFEAHSYGATRTWGWNGRDWSLQHITEYYQFYRFLTFRWAHAVLRSHIIRQFNRLLAQIGISASLLLEGLRSPEEILNVRERRERGEIDFATASRLTAGEERD